jgi:hypothetical protein
MSRKRKEKKSKQKELARQLGVSRAEAGEQHQLQEKERVTRPELKLVELEKAGGLKGLLASKPEVAVAVYVVEASRTRLAGAAALGEKRVQLEKISYSRPAHIVVVACAGKGAAEALEARGPDVGLPLGEMGTAEWEAPRAVALDLGKASAVSVRGVDRTAQTLRFDLGGYRAVIEVKV